MAWSWSHSGEAYSNAFQNVRNKDRKWLSTVFAEWEAQEGGELNEQKYAVAELKAATLPNDILADYIWGKMEAQSLCSDGGHEAWCCPFGCGPHTVPFDVEAESAEITGANSVHGASQS